MSYIFHLTNTHSQPVNIGQEFFNTVTLTNISGQDVDISGFTITDKLPNNVIVDVDSIIVTDGNANYDPINNLIKWLLPKEHLAPGNRQVLTFGVIPNVNEHIINTVILEDQNGLTLITTRDIIPQSDITISKITPLSVKVGNQFTYSISVTNNGPNTAKGVVVTDKLSDSISFVSANPSQGSISCISNELAKSSERNLGTTVTWDVGTLGTNQTANLSIIVTANKAGIISNTATVTSDSNPTTANNISTTFIEILSPQSISKPELISAIPSLIDVGIVIAASPMVVQVGQQIVYTITASNIGNNTANNIIVTDILPSKVTFNAVSSSTGNVSFTMIDKAQLTWTIPSLASGTSAFLVINVTANYATVITNTATCTLKDNQNPLNKISSITVMVNPKTQVH